jgi:hypothetical protein
LRQSASSPLIDVAVADAHVLAGVEVNAVVVGQSGVACADGDVLDGGARVWKKLSVHAPGFVR